MRVQGEEHMEKEFVLTREERKFIVGYSVSAKLRERNFSGGAYRH